MPSPREKLQGLLRELFQFGSADLDFGIYRIMNFKRDVIEQFIQKDLIEAVDKELSSGMLASQSQAALELKEKAAQIRETLGDSALNGDGNLIKEFHNTKVGKEYLDLQSRASEAQERPAFEATVFNHLYAFFSRYYDNGDFLSKRRYSRREKYAIPYNGEEVYLHWANNDQYYVKTGEYFNDYRFKSPYGINVHFKLVAADIEKDNIKGDKRFFIPLSNKVTFDAEKKEITIPFQYRPLTEQEEIKYGQRNQQDAIIKEALDTIPGELQKDVDALPALVSTHHTTTDGQVSYLEHHLRQYTRRNTSDFFVHKDLKGFLTRELDFYLKNEVLNLDEMEAGGEARSEAWFQIMKVIRSIGSRVIEFLAQIEDFQKRLFEKKKFILETHYCITMANVSEDFYAEIAECETQWQEWKELLHLDEEQPNLFTSAAKNQKERRIATLKEHPTLVLDTQHFHRQFKDRLLASYDNLDELTDGLLVHGENFQALNLLLEKYQEGIKCIYIDPPYNTSENTFLYKNDYKHSSWITMIRNRLETTYRLLLKDGVLLSAIDDTEKQHLRMIMQNLFGSENYVTTIAAEVNPAGQNLRPNSPALSHDYCIAFARDIDEMDMLLRELTEEEKTQYVEKDEQGYFLWDNLRRRGGNSRPADRPGQWFPLYANLETHRVSVEPFEGAEEIWPIDLHGEQRIWRVNPDGARREIAAGEISVIEKSGRIEIVKKTHMPHGKKPKTLWKDGKHSATTFGTKLLIDILGEQTFSYPKSVHLVEDCVKYWAGPEDAVLDFCAGSGTTAHAIINLNRADDGNRRFFLVEMGEYFDTVILRRLKKVIYAPEWKYGKPKRPATAEEAERSPRIMKYIRLESYEDALNNITFPDVPKTLYDFDDYLLKYMLAWETKESETLLNVEKLASPFSYKLTITGGEELREKQVDIPETFAYLLGLNVKTRRVYRDEERHYLVYRGNIDHREIAVIWRETFGWEKEDYERDKQFMEEQKLTEGADEIFINGDSYIPKARALENVFKSRMFGSL